MADPYPPPPFRTPLEHISASCGVCYFLQKSPPSPSSVNYWIRHRMVHVILPCKVKRQYLLTCKVSRYCLLALQSRINLLMWLHCRVPDYTMLISWAYQYINQSFQMIASLKHSSTTMVRVVHLSDSKARLWGRQADVAPRPRGQALLPVRWEL